MFDKFFALLFLILFSPIFLIIIFIIYFEDGYPIFFSQKRVGITNTYFYIYKFRTMKKNTPNLPTHLLKNPDFYLLKSGKFLRKTSLDELPNFFNILKGQMVFIGPRPALYNQYDLITLRTNNGIDKLMPGITGWAQVNGRDELSIKNKVNLEKEYLEKKSIYFNIKIIFKTFYNVLIRKGINH
jgi:O-antigen biosynthesis protein WbqP